jgi:hypothetical protein
MVGSVDIICLDPWNLIGYSRLRSTLENYLASLGIACLEKMEIPVQTLSKLVSITDFPEQLDVDAMADYIRSNRGTWRDIGLVDSAFIYRAIGLDAR